ncbi:MAG: protein kinase [Planctomycetota bacterium]|jgi:tetratricopeptide (TPR) repeat protein|nr:protein kinase [Planctomycetota bacterium]
MPNAPAQTCPECHYQFVAAGLGARVFCPQCGHGFNAAGDAADSFIASETIVINPFLTDNASAASIDASLMDDAGADASLATPLDFSFDRRTPQRFGDYEIIAEIARGGIGVVYRARHRFLNRVVALKVLRSGASASTEDVARFMREAKAVASLTHPNIVHMHEFSIEHGLYYFTMDFIDGASLDRLMEREPLSPYRACEIIETIARAIHYAHTRGIVHRDLKPANVMIARDLRPLVTDFGLAVNLDAEHESERMTHSGAIMGTIPYIPPEQASGKVELISPRSDVYSLGATFYEMLVGRPPFSGLTQYELLQRVINQNPVEPRRIKPHVASDLQTICLKCLEKEPARRYVSALALAEDCRAFLRGEPIAARQQTVWYRLRRFVRRYPAQCLLAGLVVLFGLALDLTRRQVMSAQKELSAIVGEHQLIVGEKQKLDARIERSLRPDFALQLGDHHNLTFSPSGARNRQTCWYNPVVATPRPDRLQIRPLDDFRFSAFGAPVNLPPRYQIDAAFVTGDLDPGGYVEILLGVDGDFRADRSATLHLRLATNGARLIDNETTLVENSAFSLQPQTAYALTIAVGAAETPINATHRSLWLAVNGQKILNAEVSADAALTNEKFAALACRGATIGLQKFNLSIPGLSQEMVASLLEIGDELSSHPEDKKLARTLYRRVLQERVPVSVLLRTYFGFAKTAAGNAPDAILDDLRSAYAQLTENIQMRRGERNFVGELPYGYGLVLAALGDYRDALPFFRQACREAEIAGREPAPPARGAWRFAPTGMAPEADWFAPDKIFAPDAPAKPWQIIKPFTDGHVDLPPVTAGGNETRRYLLLVYPSDAATTALVNAPPDTPLWLNGAALPSEKNAPRLAALTSGDNYLLLSLPLAATTLNLTVEVKSWTSVNVFGLLARMDETVSLLATGDYAAATRAVAALRADGVATILREKYPNDLAARNYFTNIWSPLDRLLADHAGFSRPRLSLAVATLEVLRELGPAETLRKRELARRYNEVAEIYVAFAKAAKTAKDRADALAAASHWLTTAEKLAENWYVPELTHAEFLYQRQISRRAATARFDELRERYPHEVDLRVDLAEFLLAADKRDLDTGEPLPPEPHLAEAAMREALTLPGGKTAATFEMLAKILAALGNKPQALVAAQQALALEDTPEIREFIRRASQ